MEEKNQSQVTLTELGNLAMETKCSCRICLKLRMLVYQEMKNALFAITPKGEAYLKALEKNTETVFTDLDTKIVPSPAKKKIGTSQERAS